MVCLLRTRESVSDENRIKSPLPPGKGKSFKKVITENPLICTREKNKELLGAVGKSAGKRAKELKRGKGCQGMVRVLATVTYL